MNYSYLVYSTGFEMPNRWALPDIIGTDYESLLKVMNEVFLPRAAIDVWRLPTNACALKGCTLIFKGTVKEFTELGCLPDGPG